MTTTPRPMPGSTPECIDRDCIDFHRADCPHATPYDAFLEAREDDD